MLRILALGAFVLLAACEPTPPPPYVTALQSQCEQGNTQACGLLMQRNQAAVQAMADAFKPQPTPSYIQQSQPVMQSSMTQCYTPVPGQIVCY